MFTWPLASSRVHVSSGWRRDAGQIDDNLCSDLSRTIQRAHYKAEIHNRKAKLWGRRAYHHTVYHAFFFFFVFWQRPDLHWRSETPNQIFFQFTSVVKCMKCNFPEVVQITVAENIGGLPLSACFASFCGFFFFFFFFKFERWGGHTKRYGLLHVPISHLCDDYRC